MSGGLSERLARPELARLWDELVRRWASSDRAVATVTLRQLTEAERRALADLLGADRLPLSTCSVSVSRMIANLGVELDDLKAALRELRGPWGNRAAERAAKMQERQNLWAWVASAAQRLGAPGMLDRFKERGIVGGDVAQFEARVTDVFAVLERLPGWPNVAAITLLRQLSASGARLRYHGDFDPKGLSIAQMLVDRLHVEPWRMTAVDYEQALTRARVPLDGTVPEVGWDAALATSMRTHRRAVFEEDVRDVVLAEIRSDEQRSSGPAA